MVFGKFLRSAGPLAALAVAAGLSACGGVNVTHSDDEGVPLAELDMSGNPPTGIVLGGPDSVVITTGEPFAIDVEGSATAAGRMRFVLTGDRLAIGREPGDWGDSDRATVNITMPAPSRIAIGGSGRVTTNGLADDAQLVVGGSGEVVASTIDSQSLEVVLGGSGRIQAAGRTDRLDLSIGGSGTADMAGLQAEDADVNIGGSGNAAFASDGTVSANIAGSGNVRVRGSATCTINAIGSGRLICEDAQSASGGASSGEAGEEAA